MHAWYSPISAIQPPRRQRVTMPIAHPRTNPVWTLNCLPRAHNQPTQPPALVFGFPIPVHPPRGRYGPQEASTHIDRLSTAESIVLEAARAFISDYNDGLK